MIYFKSNPLILAALTTALLSGCGGGGDSGLVVGGAQVPLAPVATDPATSAQGVVDFLLALIGAETSDLTEPKAIEGISLATEALAEPSPV